MYEHIKTTNNYDLFELHELNRTVNEDSPKFKKLVASMKNHGWISAYPLHCEKGSKGKLKIKGGHTRFRAAQILGIPVKYVVPGDEASIYGLEDAGQGKWSTQNFFDSHVRNGVESYLEIFEYAMKTGIGWRNAASMFSGSIAGSQNVLNTETFASGRFKIKDRDHPKKVGGIVQYLKTFGLEWASDNLFVQALSKLCKIDEFEIERFKKKYKAFPYVLKKQRYVDSYLQNIEELYNFKVPAAKITHLCIIEKDAAIKRRVLDNRQKAETVQAAKPATGRTSWLERTANQRQATL